MVDDLDRMNRYGAKFFIGQLVRVSENTHTSKRDAGKVGVVHAISTFTRLSDGKRGYRYALDPSDTYVGAWYDESELDFVDRNQREEWELFCHQRHKHRKPKGETK